MSEMFGSDITPAISILATFCDGGKILATEALNKSKAFAPVKTYFDSLG